MIEPSRVLYALARDKVIPRIFGFVGRAHQTPWAGLLILAAIPPLLLIPYLASASANTAIGYVISADGMFDRMGDTDEEESAASQHEAGPAG